MKPEELGSVICRGLALYVAIQAFDRLGQLGWLAVLGTSERGQFMAELDFRLKLHIVSGFALAAGAVGLWKAAERLGARMASRSSAADGEPQAWDSEIAQHIAISTLGLAVLVHALPQLGPVLSQLVAASVEMQEDAFQMFAPRFDRTGALIALALRIALGLYLALSAPALSNILRRAWAVARTQPTLGPPPREP